MSGKDISRGILPVAVASVAFFVSSAIAADADDICRRLLPKPVKMTRRDGPGFKLTAKTQIIHKKNAVGLARMLQEDIAEQTGLELKLAKEATGGVGSISVRISPDGQSGARV